MLSLMDKGTYGVGFVMWHGYNGNTSRPHKLSEERPEGAMKYLHPFCALISMEKYGLYAPLDGWIIKSNKPHGSPMMSPMRSIYEAGKEHMVKLLPESAYVKCKYWHHTSGGARLILRESLNENGY